MPSLRLSIVLLGAGLVAACASQNTSVHKNLSQQSERQLPRRILLAQPDIRVHEISAGELVEKVDDWSDKASSEAAKSVELIAESTKLFEPVQPTQLSDAQRAALDQYGALYALVAGSANLARSSPYAAWNQRAADFDYTLGPGMAGVAESAKLDAVIFVVGTDYISSSGRKAAMAVGIAIGLFTGTLRRPDVTAGIPVGRRGGHAHRRAALVQHRGSQRRRRFAQPDCHTQSGRQPVQDLPRCSQDRRCEQEIRNPSQPLCMPERPGGRNGGLPFWRETWLGCSPRSGPCMPPLLRLHHSRRYGTRENQP